MEPTITWGEREFSKADWPNLYEVLVPIEERRLKSIRHEEANAARMEADEFYRNITVHVVALQR